MRSSLPDGGLMTTQNVRDVVRTEVRNAVRNATRVSQDHAVLAQAPAKAATAQGAPDAPGAPAPPALPQIPEGGARCSIVKVEDGDRTTITCDPLPPQVMQIARRAEETAFGLMGMLVAIIILGPFARMIARRMERRPEVKAADDNARLLQQQLLQLQQSMDSMSVEVERISESQRFQSKLLHERREV
jgi:hypothetical protein